jgi:hypothetical protein
LTRVAQEFPVARANGKKKVGIVVEVERFLGIKKLKIPKIKWGHSTPANQKLAEGAATLLPKRQNLISDLDKLHCQT